MVNVAVWRGGGVVVVVGGLAEVEGRFSAVVGGETVGGENFTRRQEVKWRKEENSARWRLYQLRA